MPLTRLVRELDETADQTGAMLDPIAEALNLLADPTVDGETARQRAARLIVTALQGQDRIEQRCRNLARAVSALARLPPDAPDHEVDAIWSGLSLDELRLAALSGTAPRPRSAHGDIEFF